MQNLNQTLQTLKPKWKSDNKFCRSRWTYFFFFFYNASTVHEKLNENSVSVEVCNNASQKWQVLIFLRTTIPKYVKIKDGNVRDYMCKLTARGVPAYCIEVDATVMEHEFVLWSRSFSFKQWHEVVAIKFSEKVRVDMTNPDYYHRNDCRKLHNVFVHVNNFSRT